MQNRVFIRLCLYLWKMISTPQEKILFKATFNPIVKTYIFWYGAFILFVTIIGIPIGIIWLLGLGQWYSRHYFQKLECELTTQHLRFKKGILFQVEKTIPLENIQDLTFMEGPLLRALHLTVIRVETAGQSQHQAHEMSLIGIIDATVFRQMLLDQRQKGKRESNKTVDSAPDETLLRIANSLERIEKILRDNQES